MAEDMSQTETIRILASIQTTNEFILRGMTDLKTEMGKVGEVVQAHAILLQAHSTEIGTAKSDAKEAAKRVEEVANRMATQEVHKSHWSTDNVKVIMIVGSIIYAILEVIKMLLTAALHPAVAAAVTTIAK